MSDLENTIQDLLGFTEGKKYNTIYADPPWQFQNRTGKVAPEHKRLSRYETMTLEEIKALPVSEITAEKAHLYLWVPNALLPDGLAVMDSWGFEYKGNLVWEKIRKDGNPDGRGVGFYFRNVTELLLFGIKKKSAPNRTLQPARSQVNLIRSRKREHSRKPDEIIPIIEACSQGPRIELFARGIREGWDMWGDQADAGYAPTWNTYANHTTSVTGVTEKRKEITMKEYKPFMEGKVREIYDLGDRLVITATDRISAFDNILKNQIPDKGAVLTQMSRFWFDFTEDVVDNHMISVDPEDMPEYFRQERFKGSSMLVRKLTMLPIECIVRGYITGSGWASYQKDGTVCGIALPEGLVESDRLPEPIYTPSTKAELGEHDENISYERSVEVLEKHFPGKGQEYAQKLRDNTIALYKKCAEYALERGIIIADTKFEFGLDENGEIVIGDEMLTPDSSRFWPKEGYRPGQGQPSFDKQYVRDWLKENPGNDGLLPEEVVAKTVDKYKEAYELLTGAPFK